MIWRAWGAQTLDTMRIGDPGAPKLYGQNANKNGEEYHKSGKNARKKQEKLRKTRIVSWLLKTTDTILLDDNKILQAVYYYYNMSLSYGPMFLGWPSSNEIKPDKFNRLIALQVWPIKSL